MSTRLLRPRYMKNALFLYSGAGRWRRARVEGEEPVDTRGQWRGDSGTEHREQHRGRHCAEGKVRSMLLSQLTLKVKVKVIVSSNP